MRLRDALALLVAAGLASCGRGQDGVVKMRGFTPNTGLQKDTREIRAYCPNCGMQVEVGAERCPDQRHCKARIDWDEKYRCAFCGGTGKCRACYLMEKEGGQCFNCKGKGFLPFRGRTPQCPDCKGSKVCTVCKGSQNCDYCGGEKTVALATVRERARKPSEGKEEGVEEKKPAEKKPEEAKPAEEKK